MTDLTEKWKKGKLKEGVYYIEYKGIYTDDLYVHFDFYNGKQWKNFKNINRVLGVVPSYEEYLTMKDCAKMVFEAAERETKLKELLKECSPYVSRSATSRITKNSVGHKKDMKLFTEIDEVLK